jgi:hypothetical protein
MRRRAALDSQDARASDGRHNPNVRMQVRYAHLGPVRLPQFAVSTLISPGRFQLATLLGEQIRAGPG